MCVLAAFPARASHRELDDFQYYTVLHHFYRLCQFSQLAYGKYPVPQSLPDTLMMSSFGYRGGRRLWRGSSGSTLSQGPIQTPPAPPLGSLIEKVTPLHCTGDDDATRKTVSITDTKFLASYNWTDAKDPSIMFPGRYRSKYPPMSQSDHQKRYACTVEPSARSDEASARLWKVFQGPKCREAPKASHGTGGQSDPHTESAFRYRSR